MRQEPLVIEENANPENGVRILRLKGPIVISNLFDFQNRVRSSTARALILDMTDVPYVDSAGVGVLVGAYVTHQKDGRSLALAGVSDRVRGTLSVTQVESFFRFFDSVAAAEQAAASSVATR
jgi:anti-sigma B factor antagonist